MRSPALANQIRNDNEVLLAVPLIAFVLSIATGAAAPAQQAQNKDVVSFNYGFVSPNTRDDLKLEDAIRGMNSAEETKLLRHARNLGCVVRLKIATMRALGSWSDGAEHSILLRANSDESTIRYLMSRLGREANQKAVIYFHPEAFGSAGFISSVCDNAPAIFLALLEHLIGSGLVSAPWSPANEKPWSIL
jgi:hypothetical protein